MWCASRTCRPVRGRHTDVCPGPDCVGCQPRPAVDGTLLCQTCTGLLTADLNAAAVVYTDLVEVLNQPPPPPSGTLVTHTSSPDRTNTAAMDARAAIATVVVEMVAAVRAGRSLTGQVPAGVPAGAAWLAVHVPWIAAHMVAHVAALRETVNAAHRVAYPVRGHSLWPVRGDDGYVTCPSPQCPGYLWAVMRTGDQPSELVCNATPPHRWAATDWIRLGYTILGRAAA